MSGPNHHEEVESYAEMMQERDALHQADEIIASLEKRRFAIVAAVALCMNDERLTDLGTLKRSWFYAETGRDEPVGSRTWEELRVMVREHNAAHALSLAGCTKYPLAAGMTDEQRKILDRHLAALEDDARAMNATAELFRPEFDACWERDADGRMGQTLNGERALQLRDIVLTGPSNAAYNRKLADAIRALMDPTPSLALPASAIEGGTEP